MSRDLVYDVAIGLLLCAVTAVVILRVEASLKQASPSVAATDAAQAWAHDQPKIETKQQLFSQDHTADVQAIEQVWAAYGFFIDSGNGKGATSLYTQDAVVQHFWKDKDNTELPHGGAGSFATKYGTTRGGPCIVRGRKQIEEHHGRSTVMPMPGWGHHTSPNMLVKVNDDGKTAMLTATMLIVGTNEKGDGDLTTGNYSIFFEKSASEGWLIARQYNFADRPRGNPDCDANGPLRAK